MDLPAVNDADFHPIAEKFEGIFAEQCVAAVITLRLGSPQKP